LFWKILIIGTSKTNVNGDCFDLSLLRKQHRRASWGESRKRHKNDWIPAFAGMTLLLYASCVLSLFMKESIAICFRWLFSARL